MIGLRTGLRLGLRTGLAAGIGADQFGGGLSVDALSRIAVPANNAEWSDLLALAGVSNTGPASVYSFQDTAASAQIADVNGLYPLPEKSTNHLWQQSQSGWSRLAAQNVYTAVDNGFVRQHLNLPDPSTNSFLLMAWVALTATPTADCGLLSTTDGAIYAGLKLTTLYPSIGNSGGESSRGSTALPSSGAFPIALKYDITNKVHKFYGPHEILNRAFALASTGQAEVDFGVALASGIFAASAAYLWGSLFTGPAAEIQDNDIGAIWSAAGWSPSWYVTPTADATSGKYFPLAKNQWTKLGITPPAFCWGLQESSGLIFNDYIGNVGNGPLIRTGTNGADITLGQSVTGWSRLSIKTTDGVASQVLSSTDSHLPAPSSTSQALLVYLQVNAAASGVSPFWSWVAGMGSGQVCAIHVDTSGHFGIDCNANHTTGTVVQTGSVIPALLVYDKTNSRVMLYTKGEKITGTYNALAGVNGGVYIGSNSATSVVAAGFNCLGAAMWEGPAAEFTDTGAHNLLTALGWTGLPF